MATTDSTEHDSIIRVIQNPLVGESAALTAESVANVLAFLSVVQPTEGTALNEQEEQGRFLILRSCIDALGTISGTEH